MTHANTHQRENVHKLQWRGGEGEMGEGGKRGRGGGFSLRAGVTGSFYQIITARKINPRETQPRQRGLPASTVYVQYR